MPLDWTTLHKVLRDETRKQIILNLEAAGLLTYTDLLNRLEITNTGKLNYHLKMLNDLVTKNEQGAYMLTERGKAAAELLDKFPSQIGRALKGFDVLIIGLVGLLLTGIPVFLVLFSLPSTVYFPLFLLLFYLLFVPSFVMWKLTTRRVNSHDLYDLVKAPLVVIGAFYLLILLVLFIPLLLATAPPTTTTTTSTTQIIVVVFLWFFLYPLIPLLGVLLFEGVYRLRSH